MTFTMKGLLISLVAIFTSVQLFENYYTSTKISVPDMVNGLVMSSHVKTQIVEFYYSEDRYPSSNKELDIPPAEELYKDALTQLEVLEGGVIKLTFDEKSGVKNGVLRMKPSLRNNVVGIEWKCTTTDYPRISKALSYCTFIPDY